MVRLPVDNVSDLYCAALLWKKHTMVDDARVAGLKNYIGSKLNKEVKFIEVFSGTFGDKVRIAVYDSDKQKIATDIALNWNGDIVSVHSDVNGFQQCMETCLATVLSNQNEAAVFNQNFGNILQWKHGNLSCVRQTLRSRFKGQIEGIRVFSEETGTFPKILVTVGGLEWTKDAKKYTHISVLQLEEEG